MSRQPTVTTLRVRYFETDPMGTFYNARALEWFEVGRTELLRGRGLPYAEMERRGVLLPMTEASIRFVGRAGYDEELTLRVTAQMSGRARMRFDVEIVNAAGEPIVRGHTVHAVTDRSGKPIRPPSWVTDALADPPE